MGLYDFTFFDLIRRNATCFGKHPAWSEVDENQTYSFLEYETSVSQLASGLQQVGIIKGDRIGVLGKNSYAFFLLYGAAAAVGAIVLPINWRLSADEVAFNLNDGTPKLMFADQEYHDLISGIKSELPSVKGWYNLKADQGDFDSMTALMEPSDGFEPVEVGSDDGLVIIHTAAVAGRPRGALLSHANVLLANLHLLHYFDLSPADNHLNLLPLFHVAGLFMATAGFHAGAVNTNMSRFDAGQAAQLIQDQKVTFFFDFPPILGAILTAAEENGRDLSSLKSVIGLGTPEDIAKFQTLSGGTYFGMYGQTETSLLATVGRFNDCPGSAGQPIPMAEVRVVDDYDRLLPPENVGEIVMKGPMVFKGYWNLPEDNAYTFREGWHHTGDLGRFDEDGRLWYAGRKAEKELIKPGGENVYPAEVEKAILKHPDVDQVVVFGVPHPKWKEGIKAVCVLKPEARLDAETLIAFVGKTIASFKKPHFVEFVDEMPQDKDGAIDREAVKTRYGTE